jgi:hypothetical protein
VHNCPVIQYAVILNETVEEHKVAYPILLTTCGSELRRESDQADEAGR